MHVALTFFAGTSGNTIAIPSLTVSLRNLEAAVGSLLANLEYKNSLGAAVVLWAARAAFEIQPVIMCPFVM